MRLNWAPRPKRTASFGKWCWETMHDWFCVCEVVKDSSSLARDDDSFIDIYYRDIRSIISPNKRNSSTIRYSYAGLESVREDDEYDESSSTTTTDQKTNIVYV